MASRIFLFLTLLAMTGIIAALGAAWLFPEAIARVLPFAAPFTDSLPARLASFGVFSVPAAIAMVITETYRRNWNREHRHCDTLSGILHSTPLHITDKIEESGLLGRDANTVKVLRESIAGRLVATIFNDEKFSRFEPIHSLIDHQKPLLAAPFVWLASCQTVAIRLGILGTFLGLIMALGNVQEVFDRRAGVLANSAEAGLADEIAQASEEIGILVGRIVQELALAFSTSIAGLIAAITILFLINILRERQYGLLKRYEALASEVQYAWWMKSEARSGIVRTAEALKESLNSQRQDVQAVHEALQEQTGQLKETAETLAAQTATPAAAVSENVTQLSALLGSLQETLKESAHLSGNVTELHRKTMEMLTRTMGEAASVQKDQTERLIEGYAHTQESILGTAGEQLREQWKHLAEELTQTVSDGTHKELFTTWERAMRQLQEQNETAMQEQRRIMRQLSFRLPLAAAASVVAVAGCIAALNYYRNSAPLEIEWGAYLAEAVKIRKERDMPGDE